MFTKIYDKTKRFIKENYGFILTLIGIVLIFNVELPYVIESPGGSIDLNERVEVENGYETDGSFGMAYVSMIKGSIPFLLASYVMPNWDIVPKDDIKYDNETMADMFTRDKLSLQEAIDNATISAFREAGKSLEIIAEHAHVAYIDEKADTDLKIGDEIVSVDSKSVKSMDELKEIILARESGDVVEFVVIRDEEEVTAKAILYDTEDGPKAGISLIMTYDFETEQEVNVKVKSSESGPSGGLMTGLMIYNSLVEEDISKGRNIIGTGTIDIDGNVGIIGGIKYKLIGADKKEADIFLCPKDNLEEALKVKKEEKLDIEIIGVSTLREAIDYLNGE